MDQFLDKSRILSNALVGFELEFFTATGIRHVASSMGKALGKKIVVPVEVKGLGEKTKKHHSDFVPTADVFKAEPDFSGGKAMREVVTGPLPYWEARAVLIDALRWIRDHGWTTYKCALHINISFDPKAIPLGMTRLEHVDRLKFVLSFDEEQVYRHFPRRRGSVYARTIKQIIPANRFVFKIDSKNASREAFILPSEKYFGVNFIKQPDGYLEYRYVGGEGYERKAAQVLEIMEYCALHLWETMRDPALTESDARQLDAILAAHRKAVDSFSDYERFVINYPDIRLTVDLDGSEQKLKTYYTSIRDRLFDLIVLCGLRRGLVNLDTDPQSGRAFQLRDAKLRRAYHIEDVELVKCEVSGIIKRSDLYDCTVTDSQLEFCRVFRGNTIRNSKLAESPVYVSNVLEGCYVDNKLDIINADVRACIIRSGEVGMLAKVDGKTELIDGVKRTEPGKDGDESARRSGEKK